MKKTLFSVLTLACAMMASMLEAQVVKVWKGGEVLYTLDAVDSITFQDPFNGYGYVDLGLPSGKLWATANVGAGSPLVPGWYFGWGEIAPKDNYYWGTYRFCQPGSTDRWSIFKYTIDDHCYWPKPIDDFFPQTRPWYDRNDNFIGDSLLVLLPEDDAVHVNMGGAWRMPTIEELRELYENCTWTVETVQGYKVLRAVGPNQAMMYIPFSGWYDRAVHYAGSPNYGYLWSSSLSKEYSFSSQFFGFNDRGVLQLDRMMRYYGYPVRGIIDPTEFSPTK